MISKSNVIGTGLAYLLTGISFSYGYYLLSINPNNRLDFSFNVLFDKAPAWEVVTVKANRALFEKEYRSVIGTKLSEMSVDTFEYTCSNSECVVRVYETDHVTRLIINTELFLFLRTELGVSAH